MIFDVVVVSVSIYPDVSVVVLSIVVVVMDVMEVMVVVVVVIVVVDVSGCIKACTFVCLLAVRQEFVVCCL